MNDLIAEYAEVSDPSGVPACVWERVSTTMTRQEIKAQTRDTRRFLGNGGYRVVKVFRFEASAYKGNHRGQQAEMLADVEAGMYKVIISAMTSRYERQGVKPALRLALDLDLYGGRMVAIDDPHYGDMSDEIGIISTVIKAKQDHGYSKSISENVTREFGLMEERGAWRGAIPGGYTTTGEKRHKKLVRHPVTGDLVAQAFRDCAKGVILAAIARTFKAANERHRTQFPEGARKLRLPQSTQGIANMIRHEVYSTGRYLVKRADASVYVYQGPPLVTVTEQKEAIAALEGRFKGNGVVSRAISKDDFSGAVLCAEHGGIGYRHFGGGRPRKDGTRGVRSRRYLFQCCHKSVRADDADATIDAIMSADVMPWYVPHLVDPNAERDQALEIVARELAELPAKALDEEAEDAKRAELRAERKRLQAIPDQSAVTYGKVKTGEDGRGLTEGDKWRMMSPAERRDWLTGGNLCVFARAAGDWSGRVLITIEEPGKPDGELVTEFEDAG